MRIRLLAAVLALAVAACKNDPTAPTIPVTVSNVVATSPDCSAGVLCVVTVTWDVTGSFSSLTVTLDGDEGTGMYYVVEGQVLYGRQFTQTDRRSNSIGGTRYLVAVSGAPGSGQHRLSICATPPDVCQSVTIML